MQVILQGSLRHFPAAELLTFLCSRGQNGTLDLDIPGRRTRVLFENDTIVWAESSKVADPTEAVLDVFEWTAGNFTLLDSLSLPENAKRLSLTLPPLLEEAKRRAEGPYRDETLFRVVENPAQAQVSLTGEEFKILFRLSNGRTFAQLMTDLGLDRKALGEKVKKLEDLGLVHAEHPEPVTEPQMAPRTASRARTAAKPAPPSKPEAPPAAAPPRRAEASAAPAPPAPAPSAPSAPPAEHPFAPKTEPIPKQEDAEATRIERAAIQRNTLSPKTLDKKKTLVGSLTPDDRPETVYPLLDAECTIGRAAESGIVINDGSISSRHARIVRTPDGFTIEDLQSRNGTFVNGDKVDKIRTLADGDVVRIGKIIMTFNVAQEAIAAPKTQMMRFE
jgi:hypothetical protein